MHFNNRNESNLNNWWNLWKCSYVLWSFCFVSTTMEFGSTLWYRINFMNSISRSSDDRTDPLRLQCWGLDQALTMNIVIQGTQRNSFDFSQVFITTSCRRQDNISPNYRTGILNAAQITVSVLPDLNNPFVWQYLVTLGPVNLIYWPRFEWVSGMAGTSGKAGTSGSCNDVTMTPHVRVSIS